MKARPLQRDLAGRLGNRHQAAQVKPRKSSDRAGESAHCFEWDAGFGLLARYVDLDEDIERRQIGGALLGQAACNFFRLDRMHPGETLGGEPGLVALERADQMPLQAWNSLHFLHRVLDIVFTERALSSRARLLD